MSTTVNEVPPTVMHIDLNLCFARTEQQAHVLLRNKPVGVAAYVTDNGCVVSPSVEAKVLGVKTAMTVKDARSFAPGIIILPPDPPKYRHVHQEFCRIFKDYSPDVTPLSIDEAVINLANTPALRKQNVAEIAHEIKARIREEIGCYMSCSIGVGTNRFMAKTAAGLKKPDGLSIISHRNLASILGKLELMDLCGIAGKNAARLQSAGINTPLEFFNADEELLRNRVFESINGYYWHRRLHGFEIDGVDHERGSYGNSYSLKKPTTDPKELSALLMKLSMKASERMRRAGYSAQGVHVAFAYGKRGGWHKGRKFHPPLYADQEVHRKALYLMNMQPSQEVVTNVSVACFDLIHEGENDQLSLFADDRVRYRKLAVAQDKINDTWGQYTLFTASILKINQSQQIIDRISFGGVKEMIEEVYE